LVLDTPINHYLASKNKVLNLDHLDFDIVSDFDIRISDFASFDPLHLSRTLYKSPLFMPNKANLLDARMNLTSLITVDYENENHPQSRTKQTQSNPIPTPPLPPALYCPYIKNPLTL